MNRELIALHVAQAHPTELDVVLEILAEAAAWLQANQIQQWAYPPPPGLQERIAREIDKGDLYLAYRDLADPPVGTLRFEWSGDDLWRDQPDHTAGYVHTLAIRPGLRGQRLGEAILAWAKAHVQRQDAALVQHPLAVAEERRLFDAVAPFVDQNPITTGSGKGAPEPSTAPTKGAS